VIKMALDLADLIEAQTGLPATVASAHTIKPLDSDGIASILCSHDRSSSSKNMYRMGGSARASRKSLGIAGQAATSVASRCEMNLFIFMAPTKNCWRSTVLGCRK